MNNIDKKYFDDAEKYINEWFKPTKTVIYTITGWLVATLGLWIANDLSDQEIIVLWIRLYTMYWVGLLWIWILQLWRELDQYNHQKSMHYLINM